MNIRTVRFTIRASLWTLFSILTIAFSACRVQEHDAVLTLPTTYLFTGYPNYLVTTESYLRLYAERSIDSEVLSFARMGEVFKLIGPDGEDEFGYAWYEVYFENRSAWLLTLRPSLVYSLTQAKLMGRLHTQKYVNIHYNNSNEEKRNE